MQVSLSYLPLQLPKSEKGPSKKEMMMFSFLIQKTLTCTHHSHAAGNYHHPREPEKLPFILLITTKPFNLINSFLDVFPCNFYL